MASERAGLRTPLRGRGSAAAVRALSPAWRPDCGSSPGVASVSSCWMGKRTARRALKKRRISAAQTRKIEIEASGELFHAAFHRAG